LVVPFVHEQVTPEAVVHAVVRHCFHQIASGQLVVHVGDVQLTRETLAQQAASRPGLARLKSAIDLSLEVTGPKKPKPTEIAAEHLPDRLAASSFSETDIGALRTTWNAGGIVSVRIPVQVAKDGKAPEVGHVDLRLRRAPSAEQAAETYVRGRVSVTLSHRIAAQNAVALLAADPGPVSKFLGDSEKPNHRDWVGRRAEAKGYKNPNLPLRIIKNALRDLHAIVTQTEEAHQIKDVLKQFFNTPAPAGEPKPQPPKPKPPVPPPPPPEPIEDTFVVTQTKDGFKVVLKSFDEPTADFVVTAVYDVRRGKPKWSIADFDMNDKPIKVKAVGTGTYEVLPDKIRVQGAEPGFQLTVTGFDRNRDLKVRADLENQDA
ncbi:MAG: hypothetical protein O9272_14685, partial [Brevundimonas sp.]|nr:hypothetical protein [Brevundimonas sp.]